MLTRDQKIALVERALYEAFDLDEGAELSASESWVQVVTPGAAAVFHNQVFRSVLAEHEADARIAATVAAYRAHGVAFLWIVGPSSRPADLGDRLLAAGFQLTSKSSGMIGEPGGIRVEPSAGVTVEQVDEGNLDAWIRVYAAGWQLSEQAAEQARERLRRHMGPGARSLHFLARLGAVPTGTGSIEFCNGFAHLRGGVVLPEHRGRGVFRSLVAARLRVLSCQGVEWVTVHAVTDTSAPILRAIGFESVCELLYYTSAPP